MVRQTKADNQSSGDLYEKKCYWNAFGIMKYITLYRRYKMQKVMESINNEEVK